MTAQQAAETGLYFFVAPPTEWHRHSSIGLAQDQAKKEARDIIAKQPVSAFGEGRVIDNRIAHREADEPVTRQIVINLGHQLLLTADRVERIAQNVIINGVRNSFYGDIDSRPNRRRGH